MTALVLAVTLAWGAATLSRRSGSRSAVSPGLLVTARRRDSRVAGELPGLLDRVAAELRSGGSVLGALEAIAGGGGPLAGDARGLVDRVRGGATVAQSLAAWGAQRAVAPVGVVAGALEMAVDVGGRCAPALEGLSAALADHQGVKEEAAALSAQARASAVVVGLAPLGSLTLSGLADGRVPDALLRTGPGRGCLVAGLLLEAGAALWMVRILRTVDR